MISFGKRVELFVDDYLIDKTENARLTLTKPECRGKVIAFDEEWEAPGSIGLAVFEDEGKVKMYYRGDPRVASGKDEDEGQNSCYAESTDGIHFEKVTMRRIESDGSLENNIVRRDSFCHNFAPFLDPNPDCKPDEKYKAVGGVIFNGGIHVFGSPDGINWKLLHDGPVITYGSFDSMNTAFYDTEAGVYRCYSRYMTGDDPTKLTSTNHRAIQSSTSKDFIHWTHPVPNEYVGMPEINEHFYTNATRPIPGAPHMLVSFPMRYNQPREPLSHNNPSHMVPAPGVSDATFMTSRDGVHWNRTFPGAWLSGSLTEREWTHRCFITLSGIIERGDDFFIYVNNHYCWDDHGIWCYAVPRFRFASVYADTNGGSFTTKILRFESDTFCLNYSTAAYGDVKVSVFDKDGALLGETDLLYGNELSRELTFAGIAGKEGYLRFDLKDAHIYAVGSKMTK